MSSSHRSPRRPRPSTRRATILLADGSTETLDAAIGSGAASPEPASTTADAPDVFHAPVFGEPVDMTRDDVRQQEAEALLRHAPVQAENAADPVDQPLPRAAEVPVAPRPARRPRRTVYALAVAVAVAIASYTALRPDAAPPGPAPAVAAAPSAAHAVVSVAAVERIALSPQRRVSASVHSRSDARLAAEVGGRVLELAEVGNRLRRGEPLARLDTAALDLAVREQQARIGRLGVEAEQAERQLRRFRQLGSAGHVSGLQLDEADARLQSLQAQQQEARAALAQLQLQIRRATPRAPFDGVVVERYSAAGELLGSGAPLLRLVDPADLEIRARAPVALAATLQAGSEVALQVDGREHRLPLGTVVPVGDEVSRQLELRLPVGGLDLTVGRAVELDLPTAEAREVLVVPRDAVVLRREGSHVLRIGTDAQAERVAVETGDRHGERIEVRGELAVGDRVIVRGGERLREGQRVAVADAPAQRWALR
ncbi:MAG: efflux RND transporter periplasmic adaptor subunit [Xanthomonadales bacterium]|jgi:RND family efflux transporter MFP subunit|nr:efflux RND transporter periplasmic adaptor subunit [Xanthomonadales bacterium]